MQISQKASQAFDQPGDPELVRGEIIFSVCKKTIISLIFFFFLSNIISFDSQPTLFSFSLDNSSKKYPMFKQWMSSITWCSIRHKLSNLVLSKFCV